MGSAYDIVMAHKANKADFQNVVNFMKEIMDMQVPVAGYPEWYLGVCHVMGNRYDKLEVADEFGSWYVLKDCEESRNYLRNKLLPHYNLNKEDFFVEDSLLDKFFNLYKNEGPFYCFDIDRNVHLEKIVDCWKTRYGAMTDNEFFHRAYELRNWIVAAGTPSYGSGRNPPKYSHSEILERKYRLIDMFYYSIFYKHDSSIIAMKPKTLQRLISADNPNYRTYLSHEQYDYFTAEVIDSSIVYNFGKGHMADIFPSDIIMDKDEMYSFNIPDGYILCYEMGSKYVLPLKNAPSLNDAISAFRIGIYDIPNTNMGGGGGAAIFFMRDGTYSTVVLDEQFCDECWE